MAKGIVTVESGFKYKGKTLRLDEETPIVSADQMARWEKLGYAKATKGAAQSASKASPKAAANKAANAAKTPGAKGRANAAAKKAANVVKNENKTTGDVVTKVEPNS